MAKAKVKNPGTYTYTPSKTVKQDAANVKTVENQKPGAYKYSSDVVAAKNGIAATNALNPGQYVSRYGQQMNDALNSYLNRDKFTYDMNGDALYKVFKDLYVAQGKKAMDDTVGRASAMTGGFGNSYAVTAGSQTYQNYLDMLNSKVPELYQLASDRYNQEGQELLNRYSLLSDAENSEYNRYNDRLQRYLDERAYATDVFNNERAFDYGKYSDDYNRWLADRDYARGVYDNDRAFDYGYQSDVYGSQVDNYNTYLAELQRQKENEQWQKSFDEGVREFNIQQANKKSSSGGSGGSGRSGGSGGSKALGNYYSTVENQLKKYLKDGDTAGAEAYIENLKKTYNADEVDSLFNRVFGKNPGGNTPTVNSEKVTNTAKGIASVKAEFARGNTLTVNEKKVNSFDDYVDEYLALNVSKGNITENEAYAIMNLLGVKS